MSTVQIDKAVIERAIEAIEAVKGNYGANHHRIVKTIKELNAALAASQEPAQAVRSDGMPASADERYLRRILAQYSGIEGIYFDDGEASGQSHDIVIDFMRDSVKDLDIKLLQLGRLRFQKELQASQAAEPEPVAYIDAKGDLWDYPSYGKQPTRPLYTHPAPIAQAVEPEPFESTGDFEADIANLESAIYDNTNNTLPRNVLEFLVKLYTHPAPAKQLSDEQKGDIAMHAAAKFNWFADYSSAVDFVIEQTEADHGIKETS